MKIIYANHIPTTFLRKDFMAIRGELFTKQVTLENRSYFFNVKQNRTGDVFLQVVESKSKDGGDFDRHQIAIFADDLQKFLQGMDESLQFIGKELKAREKAKAEKKAAKEAKFARGGEGAESGKKIYRRKGERRLVASKTAKRVHVVSKRKPAAETTENSEEK